MNEEELKKALAKIQGESGESSDDLLRKLVSGALNQANDRKVLSPRSVQEKLRRLYRAYVKSNDFEEGDYVEWKEDLKNRKFPTYGEPVIVVEILDEPIISDQDSGSQYFREPLDIKLGWVDSDGEFAIFHYDSNRFRKFGEIDS